MSREDRLNQSGGSCLINLAPISVSVYTRLEHFRRCIEALAANDLAGKSVLYVFSDAPRSGDEEAVRAVREYAETIAGFKEVVLVFQEVNGYLKNMRDARELPVNRFGRVIRLEDDIVTAPGFLRFVNGALQFYGDSDQVLNVTGYAPPIQLPKTYEADFFVLQRPCAWGIGYGQEMLDVISRPISREQYLQHKRSKKLKAAGLDVLPMVRASVYDGLVAGDVRAMFYQLLNDKITIYPRKSLVQNIGHDGTGINCVNTGKFLHSQLWQKRDGFEFSQNLALHPAIVRENYKFRSPSLIRRTVRRLREKSRSMRG